jgi:hypothetical protein
MARFSRQISMDIWGDDAARLNPLTAKIQVLGILDQALNEAFKSHSL